MKVEFTVPGVPVGKGRPRFVRATGRTYTPDKTLVYENWVRECWRNANAPKLQGEIWAFITAYFPIPQSTTKEKRKAMSEGEIWYGKKPDSDNVAKAVLDSLNGIAYNDDSQVTYLVVSKLYSDDPRCAVKLMERPSTAPPEGD